MVEKILKDKLLFKFMEKIDADIAKEAQAEGCNNCGNVLHYGNYERKPRGLPEWDTRFSLCCSKDGCRKRKTPPSVRFLGRKVYAGVVIVLVCAMVHGLKPDRVRKLCDNLKIDMRTLKRWLIWWREIFAVGSFWKAEKSRFMPRLDEAVVPLSLVDVFGATKSEGLIKLMKFLSPISVPTRKRVAGM